MALKSTCRFAHQVEVSFAIGLRPWSIIWLSLFTF